MVTSQVDKQTLQPTYTLDAIQYVHMITSRQGFGISFKLGVRAPLYLKHTVRFLPLQIQNLLLDGRDKPSIPNENIKTEKAEGLSQQD